MKLLVAVPALDYVATEFMVRLLELTEHLREERIDFEVDVKTGTLVYIARDRIVAKAINDGFTHVLWVDSDMIFEPEMFDDLWDVKKDIVTGRFISRRPPYPSCQFVSIDNIERVKDYPFTPFKIGGTGLAFTLTTCDVLRAVQVQNGTCFTPLNGVGEDLAFCKRALELGYEIWCEPTVNVGHLAHIPVYPGDDENYMRRVVHAE